MMKFDICDIFEVLASIFIWLLNIAIIGGGAYVLYHFIVKFW